MFSSKPQPILLVAIACSLTIVLGVGQSLYKLTRPWPIHQWESGMVSECQRLASGLPVFEPAETGHATHMYGPLTNLVIGGVFKLTGPSLYPGRLLSVCSLVFAIAILIRMTKPAGQWMGTMIVVAMFAGFGTAANSYVEIRPDCVSALVALVAVWLMFEAFRRDCVECLIGASVAAVIAMLFRQPAAMITGIPLVATLVSRKKLFQPRRLLFCLTPFAACLGVLGLASSLFPQAFHYLVAVPSSYPVSVISTAGWLGWFALITAGLWIALFWIHKQNDVRTTRLDNKTAWLIAAVIITLPCCVITAGKEGGTSNSLLLALFAVSGLFLHWSEPLQRLLNASGNTKSKFPPGVVLGACMLLPMWVTSIHSPNSTFGDRGFRTLQRFAHNNSTANFASPYDPALIAIAQGKPGRSVMLEYDAAGWPTDVPRWFFSDLDAADYAITVAGWRAWPLSGENVDHMMQKRGFQRMMLPELSGSAYRLWFRAE